MYTVRMWYYGNLSIHRVLQDIGSIFALHWLTWELLAVGLNNGKVMIYNSEGDYIFIDQFVISAIQSIQVEDNNSVAIDAPSEDFKNMWILHENGEIVVLPFKQYPKPEFEIDRLIKYKLFNHEPINDLVVVKVSAPGPGPGSAEGYVGGAMGSGTRAHANSSSFAQGGVELTASLTSSNKEFSSETHRETVIYIAGANPTLSVYNISKAPAPALDVNKLALSAVKDKVAGLISKTFKSWWSGSSSSSLAAETDSPSPPPPPPPKEIKEETILLTSQVCVFGFATYSYI